MKLSISRRATFKKKQSLKKEKKDNCDDCAQLRKKVAEQQKTIDD
jgi:hypothetical protein